MTMPSRNDVEITGEFHAVEGDYTSVVLPKNQSFQTARKVIADQLRTAPRIQRGTWQTLDVSGSDLHITRELINTNMIYAVPQKYDQLVEEVQPDMPWAGEHFLERVSGEPMNPAPSHVRWPYASAGNSAHMSQEKFDHTYPERFWPKRANPEEIMQFPNGRRAEVNTGIRFAYGDLGDVVQQLIRNPYTRQAYLPVWFPEDTGATDYRVPCTLGYHFMCDSDMRLHMWYYMRACDFIRHFHNDVFFAGALLQWVCDRVFKWPNGNTFRPGNLNLTISSLHVFEGDMGKLP
jgi:hypothetical protein